MIIDLFGILFSLVIAALFYVSTDNIFLAIGCFILYLLAYFFLIRKRLKNYSQRIVIAHSCYQFITTFIVSLSVKPSLEDAYVSSIRNQTKELDEYTSNLEDKGIYERIIYLRKYFNMAIYKLFINVLNIYQEQGGSIIATADSLLKETNRIERTLRETTNIGNKKIIEFSLLWIITIGILVFMRFGLAEFYLKMYKNIYFVLLLCLFFAFLLGSIILFVFRFTELSIKEDKI